MTAFSKLLTSHFPISKGKWSRTHQVVPLDFKLCTEIVIGLGPLGLNQNNYPFVSVCSWVPSWLVRSTPKRRAWVWALAVDIVLCSWSNNFLKRPTSFSSLVASSYWKRDKLRPDEPHDSCAFFFCYSKGSYGGETLFGPDVVYFGEPYRTRSNPRKQAEQSVGSHFQATTRCVCFVIYCSTSLLTYWLDIARD